MKNFAPHDQFLKFKKKNLTYCRIYPTITFMSWKVDATVDFEKWFKKQDKRIRNRIDLRVVMISEEGHFGWYKPLGDGVYELKWKNENLRVYYCFKGKTILLLLNGGSKSGQSKDIQKAKKLKEKLCG